MDYNSQSQDIKIQNLKRNRKLYANLGIDTIPLKPGEKSPPLTTGWKEIKSNEAWLGAPLDANIAIRCGGKSQIAVIDCDEKKGAGAFEIALNFLGYWGLGIFDMPIVKTASGLGRHIYLRVEDPPDEEWMLLSSNIGFGELRVGCGAYVVAPPSVVEGCEYKLIQGDFSNIPIISIQQIEPLLKNRPMPVCIHPQKKPKRIYISRNAWRILNGISLSTYGGDRSRAEFALMVSLINTGHDYESILKLFHKYACAGKFQELYKKSPELGMQYFYLSYKNALDYSNNNISFILIIDNPIISIPRV